MLTSLGEWGNSLFLLNVNYCSLISEEDECCYYDILADKWKDDC